MRNLPLVIGLLAAACAFAQAGTEANTEEQTSVGQNALGQGAVDQDDLDQDTLDQATEAAPAPTGRITVFFPSGGEIVLEGPMDTFGLEGGVALECPVGEYLLQFRHPDYSVYMRKLRISAGASMLVLPELEHTGAYWATQASSLDRQRATVARARNASLCAAWVGGALSAAAACAVGGLELLLASRKDELAAAYDEYHAASAADAPGIWATIEDQKAGIEALRNYELVALGGAGLLAGATYVTASSVPTTADIDRQIKKLREEAAK